MSTELLLIDLSSIAHPAWHMATDPLTVGTQIVARVRALTSGHPHAAICVDSGRSFRAEVEPTYKAQRPESDAALHHQIKLAVETLRGDGFPVWSVRGFEADDLIASAATQAQLRDDTTVLIATADKDLAQLVGERVQLLSTKTGDRLDAAGVRAKFGCDPEQMRDWLTLVGDSSDNIRGAKGIGPKRACELLTTFGSLDDLYAAIDNAAIDNGEAQCSRAVSEALAELRTRLPKVRELVTLRTDVPLPIDDAFKPRVPTDVDIDAEPDLSGYEDDMTDQEEVTQDQPAPAAAATEHQPEPQPEQNGATEQPQQHPGTGMVVHAPAALMTPQQWERALDPRSPKEALAVASQLFASRMFSAYGTPAGILSTIMMGRELGLPAMASLRLIHNIEGKHGLSAQLMVALVLKSGLAEYFEPVEFDNHKATFVTKRKGARKEVSLTRTIEQAVQAGLVKDKSGWQRTPTEMLVARAQSTLARLVYPDVVGGLYTPEEVREMRQGDDTEAA